MAVESIKVLVVGAGQAGVAMSEHLGRNGIEHLVLERNRIAERWRSERWDSLVANGPAWHDRFPGMTLGDVDPEGFATKDQVADYFADYAKNIQAPIRCGVEVTEVRRHAAGSGFRVETSGGANSKASLAYVLAQPPMPAISMSVSRLTVVDVSLRRRRSAVM